MSGPDLKEIDRRFLYDKDERNFTFLIGKSFDEILINEGRDVVVLKSAAETIYLTWSGECCATCYLCHCEGIENLKNSKIMEVENLEWIKIKDKEDGCEVLESMGTRIKTERGVVRFESRLDHNGYYSGEIKISEIAPVGPYNDFLEEPKDLKPLEDF